MQIRTEYGNNYWLANQLTSNRHVDFVEEVGIAIRFETKSGSFIVYTPNSEEYRVTADVVDKAAEAGANFVSYSTTWCGITSEGEDRGRELGIEVLPHAGFFRRVSRL